MRLDWLTFGAMLLLMGWALADTENSEAQAEADHYCDMVQIHNESQGRYGWPNYENRECN